MGLHSAGRQRDLAARRAALSGRELRRNLYVWDAGAAPGLADQVQKYFSGRYGEFPDPWIKDTGEQKTTNAVDLAVDGNVYLLKPDGHILVFEAGAFKREIVPQGVNPALITPAGFFVTGDPETGSIYMIADNHRVLEIDKQTGALIQQVRARPDSPNHLDQLTNLYVDASGTAPVLLHGQRRPDPARLRCPIARRPSAHTEDARARRQSAHYPASSRADECAVGHGGVGY